MTAPVALALLDDVRVALEAAVLAPSIHNSQPWRFVVTGRRIDLHADPARTMPLTDGPGRRPVLPGGTLQRARRGRAPPAAGARAALPRPGRPDPARGRRPRRAGERPGRTGPAGACGGPTAYQPAALP